MWFATLPDGTTNAEPTPGTKGICPTCQSAVYAKCGSIVSWHWAHRSERDCDAWAEGETKWHIDWKRSMPQSEVTMKRDNGWHRADAVTNEGTVIEFQHSSISVEDVEKREQFYGDMVWVFDARDHWQEKRIQLFRTQQGTRFLQYTGIRKALWFCRKPIYVDVGNSTLLLLKREDIAGLWSFEVCSYARFRDWAHGATWWDEWNNPAWPSAEYLWMLQAEEYIPLWKNKAIVHQAAHSPRDYLALATGEHSIPRAHKPAFLFMDAFK